MPHNSAQWVTHVIDGGWATDYGDTFYASPQNGELRIPWLKTCENIKFYPDGSVGKHPGFYVPTVTPIVSPVSSSTGLGSSSRISTLYSFSRNSSSLFSTTYTLAVVGSWLYDISTATSPTLIGDCVTSSLYPTQLSTFNDLLIIGAGNGSPKSWDGTTFQSLAGTPPTFRYSTLHAGRHWAAGVSSNPSRLYYSAAGNPEDWVGAGSGSIDIDPGDGDVITALLSWKRELWVFKGPNKLSIHRITGTSPSDFARTVFVTGISACGPMSIFRVGDDFAFWSPRGSCHSLTNTANYGDYSQKYFNFPILSWCRDYSNMSSGSISNLFVQAVTDHTQNVSYVIFNNNYFLTRSPTVIAMDWKFVNESNPYPRFYQLTGRTFYSGAVTPSAFDPAQHTMMFGDMRGIIYSELPQSIQRFSYSAPSNTDTRGFPHVIETPACTYGPSVYKKTVSSFGIDCVPSFTTNGKHASFSITASVGGYGTPAQSLTITPTLYTTLGSFILGTDQLGSDQDLCPYVESITGESKAFTYKFTGDQTVSIVDGSTPDARMRHFNVLLSPSGEGMEVN